MEIVELTSAQVEIVSILPVNMTVFTKCSMCRFSWFSLTASSYHQSLLFSLTYSFRVRFSFWFLALYISIYLLISSKLGQTAGLLWHTDPSPDRAKIADPETPHFHHITVLYMHRTISVFRRLWTKVHQIWWVCMWVNVLWKTCFFLHYAPLCVVHSSLPECSLSVEQISYMSKHVAGAASAAKTVETYVCSDKGRLQKWLQPFGICLTALQ